MSVFDYSNPELLENFANLQRRKFYLKLMEKFIEKKITGVQFELQFCKMCEKDRDRTYSSKELLCMECIAEYLDLNKFNDLSRLISNVFVDCDAFQPDPALRLGGEISEDELIECVKEAYLKIKNYSP